MERDEAGTISKKQRVDSGVSADIPNHEEGEASSKVVETESPKAKCVVDKDVKYRLYFKGFEDDEWQGSAAYGVAICDPTDKLLFEFKETLSETWMGNKAVELRGLIRGLKESVDLGIKKIAIFCAEEQIYQFLIKRKRSFQKETKYVTYSAKEKRDFKELMEEVRGLRNFFASIEVTKIYENGIKFAKDLATNSREPHPIYSDGEYDPAFWANEGDHLTFNCPPPPPPHVCDKDNYNYDYL